MGKAFSDILAHSDAIKALAAQKGLADIRVFGSVARGDDNEKSDVDLLVRVVDASDPLAFVDFQDAVSKLLGRRIDLVFESGLYHAMRAQVLHEAKPL